jgi:hypothetical protein
VGRRGNGAAWNREYSAGETSVEEVIQTPTRQSPTKMVTVVAEQYEEEAAAACCGCRRTTSMRVCPDAIGSLPKEEPNHEMECMVGGGLDWKKMWSGSQLKDYQEIDSEESSNRREKGRGNISTLSWTNLQPQLLDYTSSL